MSDERDMRIIAEIGRRNGVVNEHTRQQAVLEAAWEMRDKAQRFYNASKALELEPGPTALAVYTAAREAMHDAISRFDAAMKEGR